LQINDLPEFGVERAMGIARLSIQRQNPDFPLHEKVGFLWAMIGPTSIWPKPPVTSTMEKSAS